MSSPIAELPSPREPDGQDAHRSVVYAAYFDSEEVWGGLPSHRSKKMTSWIDTQASWLRAEHPPPGYAHELNPLEGVWGNLKGNELANYCPNTIEELEHKTDDGLCRIGSDAQLCKAVLGQTTLRL